jgi:hypothetical protein
MSYEEVRRIVDQMLSMKHEIPAIQRMVEYVMRSARCIVTGECILEVGGRRLVCDERSCWWEGAV